MNPAFSYPGGKRKMLKYILPLIPLHKTYLEPFAGGLAVFLAKERARVEVINDLNREIANFYRYVHFHFDSLIAELEWYLHSRENFELILKNCGLTELQRAARWYLLKVSSFSGFSDSYARDKNSFRGFSKERHLPMIAELHERLEGVYIENKDWEEVFKFFDGEETFIYLDPPYCTGDSGIYDAFSGFDMQRLRNRLDRAKGKWILSCDDSEICREIFADFDFISIPIKYSAGTNTTERKQKAELLVVSDGIDLSKTEILK
jgi:DNA adenine methylase